MNESFVLAKKYTLTYRFHLPGITGFCDSFGTEMGYEVEERRISIREVLWNYKWKINGNVCLDSFTLTCGTLHYQNKDYLINNEVGET